MLDDDDIADCEGEALLAYERNGLDPERPASVARLCEALFGRRPVARAHLPREALSGLLRGEVVIYYRSGLAPERQRFVVGHEIAHGLRRMQHGGDPRVEARADLLAACLLAPRPAFARSVRTMGHRVYDLAHAYGIPQAAALLRVGEATGRPVRLLGPRERVRGEPFVWPDVRRCLAGRMRDVVHPIRLRDEQRWGLMATG